LEARHGERGRGTGVRAQRDEVRLTLDLGGHAPGDPVGLARALAVELRVAAVDVAATAAEASGSEEVHAARPHIDYRVGGREWHELGDEEA
jgi:hypothetical protein